MKKNRLKGRRDRCDRGGAGWESVSKRLRGRQTVKDLTHEGGEMKAIPRGLNTELMHDFGTDSLGQDHLYTAVVLSSFRIAGKHALWPVLCRSLGLGDNKKNDFAKVLKPTTYQNRLSFHVCSTLSVLNKYRFLFGRMPLQHRVICF